MDLTQLDNLIDGSKFFRWREFLFCPQWGSYVFPTPGQLSNLKKLALVMDEIRILFGKPIVVTSGLRPSKYNDLIRGARGSAHIEGKACDFQIVSVLPSDVQSELARRLDHLKIRMERNTGSWTHIDIRNPGPENVRLFYAPGSVD
jgi:zinc D-Ala-D-Ala carboxypeptidase